MTLEGVKMERYQGYNRKDYYFANSCREAFGSEFEKEEPVFSVNLFGLAFVVGLIVVALMLAK